MGAPTVKIEDQSHSLSYWCRDANAENSTGGFVSVSRANDVGPKGQWFKGCEGGDKNNSKDLLATTLYPIPIGADTGFQSIGLRECSVVALAAGMNAESRGQSVRLPPITDDTQADKDCYRWFAMPPQFVRIGTNRIDALFFRRGDTDGTQYAESLDVARIRIEPVSNDGKQGGLSLDPTTSTKTLRISLPEIAEPFLVLPDQKAGITLLSINRYYPDAVRAQNWRLFGWGASLLFIAFIVWRGFYALLAPTATLPSSVGAVWRSPGLGFAMAALLAGVALFVLQSATRDDVARRFFLGGSIQFSFYPLDGSGDQRNIIWHDEGSGPGHVSPAHFFQNRVSLINANSNLDSAPSLMMIAPYYGTGKGNDATIDVKLAILRLKQIGGGWEMRQGVAGSFYVKQEKSKIGKLPKLALLPFMDADQHLHALIVSPQHSDQNMISADLLKTVPGETLLVPQ
jgi:hypothetical protein